jgi:hypothetical protein
LRALWVSCFEVCDKSSRVIRGIKSFTVHFCDMQQGVAVVFRKKIELEQLAQHYFWSAGYQKNVAWCILPAPLVFL